MPPRISSGIVFANRWANEPCTNGGAEDARQALEPARHERQGVDESLVHEQSVQGHRPDEDQGSEQRGGRAPSRWTGRSLDRGSSQDHARNRGLPPSGPHARRARTQTCRRCADPRGGVGREASKPRASGTGTGTGGRVCIVQRGRGSKMRSRACQLVMAVLAMSLGGLTACGDDGSGPAAPTTPDRTDCRDAIGRGCGATVRSTRGCRCSTPETTRRRTRRPEASSRKRSRPRNFGFGWRRGRPSWAPSSPVLRAAHSARRRCRTPPPGDYFVFEFDGVYELRPNARERVTAVSESGEWPVVGIYLIR